ncbi:MULTISPECIES: VTT domain-containing protein [Rhodanobacteraceae]|uniref:TVP38/TMEM64 family protein n=1 Tax=Rhodanobacteraceae TaxID=1775411 RepID=UPI0008872A95|nr:MULTISPECIES: VTT domain-containing protein [Rhodanobacteraceae]SDF94419.1 Uncharacterized membrane protein YdjX, TVP38/TMEM64 family, SNARE-associated domain [Dyella sp. 333MFSha]SKB94844.1 Uncharacterized membrane protein YdjX, TVP38/TMEM64 family, SNARE-associated domain [Luteibacter sp. 22Crub2.1]
MKRWRAALPLALMVLAGVIALASGALDRLHPSHLLAEEGMLRASIAVHPVLSRVSYAVLLTLAIATGVPGTIVIVLAGGLLFGIAEGSALSSLALVAGSLLLYAASRHAFGHGGRQPPDLARRVREGYARRPVSYTFALRFVPVVPLGAMTVVLAWLRCPLWLFIAATWLGGTVSLVIESAIGAGLASTLGGDAPFSLIDPRILVPLCAFLVVSLLPLAARSVRTRLRRD